jgi:ABC-type transport system involved in multi-copper enzyme maturation permease subunit
VSTVIAWEMTGADLLKLRKKRSTLIWALVLALAPVVIFFVVNAIEHGSNPARYGPAGGSANFKTGLSLLGGLFFGPLVAILIGVEAGTADTSAGVFRDLVVTGRSRLALFAARVPAALVMCWSVILSGYLLVLAGTFAFASNLPTPSAALVINGLGFLMLATGVLCVVAVGFSSLVASKPAAIIALIAWQLVAGALIASITSLGSARDWVLGQALSHFSPVEIEGGRHASHVIMSGGTALVVILVWLVVFLALGAWRTRTMDA